MPKKHNNIIMMYMYDNVRRHNAREGLVCLKGECVIENLRIVYLLRVRLLALGATRNALALPVFALALPLHILLGVPQVLFANGRQVLVQLSWR